MTARPVILAVDDDPDVVRAVARDLRQAYGEHYRIVRAESAQAALEATRQLRQSNDTIALFVSDQRMPQMNGIEFLEQATPLFPEAKRVLLTAYADTDAAIRAINRVRLDYYLLKPWDPPEQKLYPVLDELLEDWKASFRPAFAGVRVVDHRYSLRGHQVRDFLARNQVPYHWLDIETHADAARFATGDAAGETGAVEAAHLPLVVLPDGEVLRCPDIAELARRVGLSTDASVPFYDVLVVGAGPAGLAAAVYGASEGLKVGVVEHEAPGGQAGTSSRIENYLGFPSGLSGAELTRRAATQARRFGAELILARSVRSLSIEQPYKRIMLDDGSELSCHALVVASGVAWRRLDAPNIEALTGRGVFYGAAMTEAATCRDCDVYIVGGGNSAGQGAVFLANYARRVHILVRGPGLGATMSQYLIDQIAATPNIELLPHTVVAGVEGALHLERIVLKTGDDPPRTVDAAALFVFIGAQPATSWLGDAVKRDRHGFVLTGRDLQGAGGWPEARDPFLLESSVPGVFAAGDVRAHSMKRVAAAVGEGSAAISFVHQYLADL